MKAPIFFLEGVGQCLSLDSSLRHPLPRVHLQCCPLWYVSPDASLYAFSILISLSGTRASKPRSPCLFLSSLVVFARRAHHIRSGYPRPVHTFASLEMQLQNARRVLTRWCVHRVIWTSCREIHYPRQAASLSPYPQWYLSQVARLSLAPPD